MIKIDELNREAEEWLKPFPKERYSPTFVKRAYMNARHKSLAKIKELREALDKIGWTVDPEGLPALSRMVMADIARAVLARYPGEKE